MQVIEGYKSNKRIYISKLDHFNAIFKPEGMLIILHDYNKPGKIGGVGMVLGSHGINVRFMQVASLAAELWTPLPGGSSGDSNEDHRGNEALMILGVDGNVDSKVLADLSQSEGVLDVSLVKL